MGLLVLLSCSEETSQSPSLPSSTENGGAAGNAGTAGSNHDGNAGEHPGGAAGTGEAGSAGDAGTAGGSDSYNCRGKQIPLGTWPLDPEKNSAAVSCGALSLRLRAPGAGVLRLTYLGKTPPPTRDSYVVGALEDPGEVVFGQDEKKAMVCMEDFYAEIDRTSCRLSILDKNG